MSESLFETKVKKKKRIYLLIFKQTWGFISFLFLHNVYGIHAMHSGMLRYTAALKKLSDCVES